MPANTIWAQPSSLPRWAGITTLIPAYFATMALGFPWKLQVNSGYASALLKTLGIRCHIKGCLPKVPSLLVSNHVSWLDPFLFAQLGKVSFVTSTDTLKDPLLGAITRIAGCQFVSRKPLEVQKELASMSLKQFKDSHLAIYPEATSGDGTKVLPFRSTFFEIAVQQQMLVQPIALCWNQELAHYFGDMAFGPHLAKVIAAKRLEATLEFLPPLDPKNYTDRKQLCQASAVAIASSHTIQTRSKPFANKNSLDYTHAI